MLPTLIAPYLPQSIAPRIIQNRKIENYTKQDITVSVPFYGILYDISTHFWLFLLFPCP